MYPHCIPIQSLSMIDVLDGERTPHDPALATRPGIPSRTPAPGAPRWGGGWGQRRAQPRKNLENDFYIIIFIYLESYRIL